MADIDREVGQAGGKRFWDNFAANWDAIIQRIQTLPTDWTALAGRVVRGNAAGTGPGTEGDLNLGTDKVAGGLVDTRDAATGNLTFTSAATGILWRSQNASDVTWTLDADAAVGTIIGWSQVGDGVITFAAEAGGDLTNASDHTKSGGVDTIGSVQVTRLNGGGKAVWKLTGETVA